MPKDLLACIFWMDLKFFSVDWCFGNISDSGSGFFKGFVAEFYVGYFKPFMLFECFLWDTMCFYGCGSQAY